MPELAYRDPAGCPIAIPDGAPADEQLQFEVELLDWAPVRIIGEDANTVKQVVREGSGWETPRAPFEVKLLVKEARVAGSTTPFFESREAKLMTVGSTSDMIPPALETAVQTMRVTRQIIL
jgi:hypothetical protein